MTESDAFVTVAGSNHDKLDLESNEHASNIEPTLKTSF